MRKRAPGGRQQGPARPKRPDPDAQAPSGISAAAVRGAMQSRHEREDQLRAEDRQARVDDNQESRRAGGKSSA